MAAVRKHRCYGREKGAPMQRGLKVRLHAIICLVVLASLSLSTGIASTQGSTAAVGVRSPPKVAAADAPRPDLPPNRKFLGVYDVFWNYFANKQTDVEEQFVDWSQSDQLDVFFGRTIPTQRLPLITIEPRTTASGDLSHLLLETATGKNDNLIQQNAAAMKRYGGLVLVRFAQGMDSIGSYPWSVDDASAYKLAFQHYHDAFVSLGVTNIQWVWSPAGNSNAPAYYPGAAYVDYVGLTVYNVTGGNTPSGNPNGSQFATLLDSKYKVVAPFGKPIVIAELAVSGSPDYQRQWLTNAFQSLGHYPLLQGIIYFNSFNGQNASKGNEPDFRIGADMIWSIDDLR